MHCCSEFERGPAKVTLVMSSDVSVAEMSDAVDYLLQGINRVCERYGAQYDTWQVNRIVGADRSTLFICFLDGSVA